MTNTPTLADRVERAEGASRELDRDIALLLGLYDRPEDLGCFSDPAEAVVGGGGQTYAPPAYTASLDAALTLVPDGVLVVALSEIAADGLPGCCLLLDSSTTPPREAWGVVRERGTRQQQLVLAVCAAALRARQETPDA